MKTQVEVKFSEFYERWMCELEENLRQLLKVSREISHGAEREALVSRVTTHLKEYYTAKWGAAHEDVLAFFSPVWVSPLESAYLWVTGWKPSTAFRLIESLRQTGVPGESLAEMSEEQMKKVEELRMKIRLEEEKVEREMERQQVALADRSMVELARLASQVRNGGSVTMNQENGRVEVAVKALLSGLERVMKAADCVRLKTLKGLLELLSPLQCVDFLAATLKLHLHLRKWGTKRQVSGHDIM